VNVDAIPNLSGILRDNIIRSHDKFQEITRHFVDEFDDIWSKCTAYDYPRTGIFYSPSYTRTWPTDKRHI